MQNKETYEYAIIRLVPKVEREEFINIGVILFSKKKKFLEMKYQLDSTRIHTFSNEVDIEVINDYLKAWQLICEGSDQGGRIAKLEQSFRFRWLAAAKSTIVQTSPTHPGLCTDPVQTLESLFERFVL